MILLRSCLIDVLKPEKGAFLQYDEFLSRYTLITVTALISQCSLMPETYEGMSKADIDRDIDSLIAQLPEGAKRKRALYPHLCTAAMLNPGEVVQDGEERFFVSEIFTKDAERYSLSNREMVLRGLNSASFLSYFFLFEETIKNIYSDITGASVSKIGGADIIKVCLRDILSKIGGEDIFWEDMGARSKFFFDLRSLELLWDILNFIRNRITHSNGFYEDKSKKSFVNRQERLAGHLKGSDEMLLSVCMLFDVFEKYEEQINSTGYLIVDDSLENIVRNVSIFVMESLYLCKIHVDKDA